MSCQYWHTYLPHVGGEFCTFLFELSAGTKRRGALQLVSVALRSPTAVC